MSDNQSIETPEQLVAKYGYTIEQASKIAAMTQQDQAIVRPLNLRSFQLAQKYNESASVLDAHISKIGNANVAPGLILCKSLALELLFKSLVLLDRDDLINLSDLPKAERENYATHTIPKLYDLIPDHHKEKLATIYSARMGVPKLSTDRFRHELVEKASDLFLKWRYIHEKSGGPAEHLDLRLVDNLIVAAQLTAIEAKQKVV